MENNLSNSTEEFLTQLMDKLGPLIREEVSKQVNFNHDDFDFTANDDATELPKPKLKGQTGPLARKDSSDVIPFSQMGLNRDRSIEERQSLKWRRSCQHWLNHFQQMGQPICGWYSNKNEPLITTLHITEVKSEEVEVIKIIANDRGERTWRYHYIYGFEVPDSNYRRRAKSNMKEYFGISAEDSLEFLKFREATNREKFKAERSGTVVATPTRVVGRLSKADVGERYERQLEWEFCNEGYHVDTYGLRKKYEDEGVDHILIKNGRVDLVQAKAVSKDVKLTPFDVEVIYNRMKDFWDKNKNNLDLLPGDLDRIMLVVANGESLPADTQAHAIKIGLVFKMVPYKDKWPEIKCVVTKEKRFYKPTDHHWIGCNMLLDKRRFWASSVEEAQAKGYKPSKAKRIYR